MFSLRDSPNNCTPKPRVTYHRKGKTNKGKNIRHVGRLTQHQGARILDLHQYGNNATAIRKRTGHCFDVIRQVIDGEYVYKEDI